MEKYREQLNSIEDLLRILVVNSIAESLKSEAINPKSGNSTSPKKKKSSGKQIDIENINIIIQFFNAVDNLKTSGIIRSGKYSGDITEYMVAKLFEVELCKSGREIGYDGKYISSKKRVQIKFHDGEKSTNIPFSDNDKKLLKDKKVQDIIIGLGRNSNIKPSEVADIPYLFYKIPAAKLLKHHGGISKGFLKKFEPVYEFSEMFENIKGKS